MSMRLRKPYDDSSRHARSGCGWPQPPAAPLSCPPDLTVTPRALDLVRDLELALDGPADLITTSALLDLVSQAWMERLAVEAAARRLPIYAALTCQDPPEIAPSDPLDET